MARLVALVLLCLSVLTGRLEAREEILHFDSLLEVRTDGGVTVSETITVRAEGHQIKRGIFRDLPSSYAGPLGDRRPSGLKVLDVNSDVTGRAYFTKPGPNYLRIYVGERNRLLKPGVYTYTFKYSMEREVRHFEGYDEIYWNVTGDQWSFPINRVTSRIVIPQQAKVLQTAAYVGRRGATGQDFSVTRVADHIVEFSTTRRLLPGEEITVAVGWPKGFVAEPAMRDQAVTWLWANGGLLALLASTLAVPWYLFSSWLRVGRDPQKGVIIPLFAPPKGLSPAAVSYIHYMALKSQGSGASKALISALVSLATKGRILLEEDDDEIAAELIDRADRDLPVGERALRDRLFDVNDRFTFNEANASRYATARQHFRRALLDEHQGVHFKDNAGHFWLAMLIGAGGIAAFFFWQRPSEEQVAPFIGVAVLSVFVAVLATVGWHQFQRSGIGKYVVGAIALLFAGGVGTAFSEGISVGWDPAVTVPGAAFLFIALCAAVFGQMLRAPTVSGRKTMDEIEGLKLYLSVAESARLNMADAPDMSQRHFEHLLPYAIALGVEKPWSDAFASHLARLQTGPHGNGGYHPTWYRGRSWDDADIGRATQGMVSAMSHSMAAATPASSGSGSGGGGSAGGGGGGGGGGGW